MAKHLKYQVERCVDDFGWDTLGRVDSLYLARELGLAACKLFPGAIIEICQVDETNTAEYLETIDGYEVAA